MSQSNTGGNTPGISASSLEALSAAMNRSALAQSANSNSVWRCDNCSALNNSNSAPPAATAVGGPTVVTACSSCHKLRSIQPTATTAPPKPNANANSNAANANASTNATGSAAAAAASPKPKPKPSSGGGSASGGGSSSDLESALDAVLHPNCKNRLRKAAFEQKWKTVNCESCDVVCSSTCVLSARFCTAGVKTVPSVCCAVCVVWLGEQQMALECTAQSVRVNHRNVCSVVNR